MKSTTLLFLYLLEIVRIKENKWSIFIILGIFIVWRTKQIECILNDIRVNEHNQNTIENLYEPSLMPCLTTSCCDRFLASPTTSCCDRFLAFPAHTHDQRLFALLWYPIPLFPECVNQFLPREGGFSLSQTQRPSRSHRCTIGLRSGEKAGHGNTETLLAWRRSEVRLADCGRALTCSKFKDSDVAR